MLFLISAKATLKYKGQRVVFPVNDTVQVHSHIGDNESSSLHLIFYTHKNNFTKCKLNPKAAEVTKVRVKILKRD